MSREKALKRINEYLAKQEPQKVELGLLQDLDKRKQKFIQKNKEIAKLIQSVEKIKAKFKGEFKDLSNEFKDLRNEYNSLLKKANEIGADDLGNKAFASSNELSNSYGQGFDSKILRFLQS